MNAIRRSLFGAALALILAVALPSFSQPLTTQQLQTIKAAIVADAALNSQPMNSDGAFAIAAALNLPAAPDFWVWRTAVPKKELVQSTSGDGTRFTWAGNGFISRSAGELTAWQELFNHIQEVNPALPNVRQAFSDIFSGSGNAAANRTHLLAIARRLATRAEKLLATGTGSTASPGTMTFEGQLTYQQVETARALP